MINAAMVGLGRWGRALVEAASGHDRLKVIRAVEPAMAGAREFCAQDHLDLSGAPTPLNSRILVLQRREAAA